MEECHELQMFVLPPEVARTLCDYQAASLFLLCFIIPLLNFQLKIQDNLIIHNLFVYTLDCKYSSFLLIFLIRLS